jgi:hypothetical protein
VLLYTNSVDQAEKLLTHVEFRSDLFPSYESEEEGVNFQTIWGKRLAEFLQIKLREEGFETKEPYAEDWGWELPIKNDAFSLYVGCGHYEEYLDGYLCRLDPDKPFVRRFFKKIDTRPRLTQLQRAIDKILTTTPGIHDIKWWTHDEFNNPLR